MQKSGLNILFVISEAAPFAVTGGLGDFGGTLPLEIASLGCDIRIVMPKYRSIKNEFINSMEYVTDYPVNLDWRKQTVIVRKLDLNYKNKTEVPSYFIDNAYYFDREQMYSNPDDAERFAFFCRAVLEMLPKIDFKPDIIHCNDWECGPICILLREQYKSMEFYKDIKTVFTIHNLQWQGNFPRDTLSILGLGEEFYNPDSLEFYGSVNYMKAGILYSDLLTTVSPTYAKEIRTPEYGHGLDGVIRKRQKDLRGIINGISYRVYNPETDMDIYKRYTHHFIGGKKENKREFQKEIGLEIRDDIPLVGMVSPLSDKKGFDLIEESIEEIIKMDLQLVILGTGDPIYEDLLRSIEKKFPYKMRAIITYNLEVAKKIFASTDIFLMPSKFEACGLNQMIALRYGAIPLVRETGGLIDTVEPFNHQYLKGNGFVFKEHCKRSMIFALNEAIALYEKDKETWNKLVERAMNQDFSWTASAKKYVELYNELA